VVCRLAYRLACRVIFVLTEACVRVLTRASEVILTEVGGGVSIACTACAGGLAGIVVFVITELCLARTSGTTSVLAGASAAVLTKLEKGILTDVLKAGLAVIVTTGSSGTTCVLAEVGKASLDVLIRTSGIIRSSGIAGVLSEVGKADLAVLTGTSGAIGSSSTIRSFDVTKSSGVRGDVLTRSSRAIGTCSVLTKIGSFFILAIRIVVLAGFSVFASFAKVSKKSFCYYSSS